MSGAPLSGLRGRLRELALRHEDVVTDARALARRAGLSSAGEGIADVLGRAVAMTGIALDAAEQAMQAASWSRAGAAPWWRRTLRLLGAVPPEVAEVRDVTVWRRTAPAGVLGSLRRLVALQDHAELLLREAEVLLRGGPRAHALRHLVQVLETLERIVDYQRLALDAVWWMLEQAETLRDAAPPRRLSPRGEERPLRPPPAS